VGDVGQTVCVRVDSRELALYSKLLPRGCGSAFVRASKILPSGLLIPSGLLQLARADYRLHPNLAFACPLAFSANFLRSLGLLQLALADYQLHPNLAFACPLAFSGNFLRSFHKTPCSQESIENTTGISSSKLIRRLASCRNNLA
jgi:hypothetical protein